MQLLEKPWPRITALSKAAKRAWIAVAYLNTGAQKLLRLGDGDVLVVDMGKKALGSGQTNPHEIIAYLKKGVRVFNWPTLHAKVYVFDQTLVIGSPNVSDTSQGTLLEAALETNAPDAVRQAKAFVGSLILNQVTPGVAEKAVKDWKPPKGGIGGGKKAKGKPPMPAGLGRCWIAPVEHSEPDDDEKKVLAKQVAQVESKLSDAERYEVDTVRYPASHPLAKQLRPGDSVIELFHSNGKVEAYPPAKVLARRGYKIKRGKRIAIHLESERDPSAQPWVGFKAHLGLIGIKITKSSQRALRTLAQRRHVQKLFET